ncbi:DUF3857 domain-containing protein [Sinomicrobium sp. M5D2P9]
MNIYTFFLLCFFSCSLTVKAQVSKYQALLLDKELTENADAVVRLEECQVEIKSQKDMVITQKRIVTVFNKQGNKYVRASVGYDNSRKVKSLGALVFDAFGKEISKFRKKDFKDVSAVIRGTLYSDHRILYLDYVPVTYPYTVEFTYEVHTPNTGVIPSWYFLDGYNVSTRESRYSLLYDKNRFRLRFKGKHLEEYGIQKEETSQGIEFLGKSIKAVKEESLSPAFTEFAPKLMVAVDKFHMNGYDGEAENWEQLGRWIYKDLLQGRDKIPETTATKIKALVAGVEDPLERAEIVYKYVQDNTRYISVQVGIGGLQPIMAAEVDKVKYGDCKGLSNYTKGLLDVAGVKSYYTHVEAGDDKIGFEPDFASLAQGNHAILAIPDNDKYVWIDCTSQIHPFGFIGDFTDDRDVLVMKPEGGEVVKTVAYMDEQNYQETFAEYTLDTEGILRGDIRMVTGGVQYDQRAYLDRQTDEDIIKRYKHYWNTVNNLKVNKYGFNNDKKKVEFTEEVQVEASGYASGSGHRLLFVVNAFNRNDFVPDRYRNRKLPFEINRGFLDKDEFTVHLPEGYEVEAIPGKVSLQNHFGEYSMEVEQTDDDTLLYKRKLTIRKGAYPKEEYDAYRDFRKEVARADRSKVVLLKQ